ESETSFDANVSPSNAILPSVPAEQRGQGRSSGCPAAMEMRQLGASKRPRTGNPSSGPEPVVVVWIVEVVRVDRREARQSREGAPLRVDLLVHGVAEAGVGASRRVGVGVLHVRLLADHVCDLVDPAELLGVVGELLPVAGALLLVHALDEV